MFHKTKFKMHQIYLLKDKFATSFMWNNDIIFVLVNLTPYCTYF